jgi:hypothetical protein
MQIDRRTLLGFGFTLAGTAFVPIQGLFAQAAPAGGVLTPEMFGARGDGRTNDTDAFEAMSQALEARGGGTIELRRATYIVGRQHVGQPGEHYGYVPQRIIGARGCRAPITIRGNGATLRAQPGLRYGTFDPRTGQPTRHSLPFYDVGEAAIPYHAMIGFSDCADVAIFDVELDGNLQRLSQGGPFGDAGIQVPGSGIILDKIRGDEIVRNVHSHHHVQDGLMINGLSDLALAGRTRRIENVRSEYNGRQGCSVVSGRGYAFANCRFAHTGKAGLESAPAAGLDIEAEEGINRDFSFTDCEFVDNAGCGMVADSGDSDGATFTRCTFVGTTAWAAWPSKPNFHFRDCTFVGGVVRNYGHGEADPSKATQYFDCLFTDDPSLSPTGQVYLPDGEGAICDSSLGDNTTFQRCRFHLTRNGMMPWSWRAIYVDCTMEQRSLREAYPKGRYLGRNTIRGPVDLYGTIVDGTLDVNGTVYRSGTRFGGAPSDAEWPPPRLQR